MGPMWVQCGSNVGLMWVQCGSNVGPMWVQCGSNVGPMGGYDIYLAVPGLVLNIHVTCKLCEF